MLRFSVARIGPRSSNGSELRAIIKSYGKITVQGEDWSSEKFGISLCENIQPEYVMSLIEEALNWLRQATLCMTNSCTDVSSLIPLFPVPLSPWREGVLSIVPYYAGYIFTLISRLTFLENIYPEFTTNISFSIVSGSS
jgi:hypothetical protein